MKVCARADARVHVYIFTYIRLESEASATLHHTQLQQTDGIC